MPATQTTPVDFWADRFGMDGVISIRHFGMCAYVADREVNKIIRPQAKRTFGASLLGGDVGFVLHHEMGGVGKGRGSTPRPLSLSACNLMNFPEIVKLSSISNGDISDDFVRTVRGLLTQIPATASEILSSLGNNFFDKNSLERVPILAAFLRDRLKPLSVPI